MTVGKMNADAVVSYQVHGNNAELFGHGRRIEDAFASGLGLAVGAGALDAQRARWPHVFVAVLFPYKPNLAFPEADDFEWDGHAERIPRCLRSTGVDLGAGIRQVGWPRMPPRQRRSLSMPRAGGKVHRGGLATTSDVLARALTAAQTDRETAETLTHPFHSYPARLHPATARVLVEFIAEGAQRDQPIVDPFCGSGTVLVEARAADMAAVGSDLSPLAVLIARAKTWTAPPRRRAALRDAGHAIAGAALAVGKAARRAASPDTPHRRPVGVDPNARDRRLARWFAPHVRRELEDLTARIDELRQRDAELADVLLACVSSLLYKVSSRTSDTDPTWVARTIGRGFVTRLFTQRVDGLVAGLADLSRAHATPSKVYESDIRKLGEVIANATAAGVITSPPYAGTYDYAEHQRLRLDFFGLRHRDFDSRELGSRRSFSEDSHAAHAKWQKAVAGFVSRISNVLAPGRAAALVIGDSIAGGRAMFALDDLRDAVTSDVALEAWASQVRPKLGQAEHRAFGDRDKAEHIVVLRRL